VLVTQLCEGQRATVLQLPVTDRTTEHAPSVTHTHAARLVSVD
jgi:hypothetical protein